MGLSLKRSALSMLVAIGVSGAFVTGQRLGVQPGSPLRGVSRLLSADAGRDGLFGADGIAMNPQDTNVRPEDVFGSVLDYVKNQYVRSYGGAGRLSDGALSEMFASLNDPKTDYLNPAMRQVRQSALEGKFHGIGAMLAVTQTMRDDVFYRYLTVVDVMPGSPAEKSGLKSGDHITEIDGRWIIAYSISADEERILKEAKDDASKRSEYKQTEQRFKAGLSLTRAVEMLTQGEGKTSKLTVTRGHDAPFTLSVTGAVTNVEPVEFRTVGTGVGYLRVRQFNQRATEVFEKALADASALKGLIIDLRRNPGGVTAEETTGVDGYTSARQLVAILTGGGSVATLARKPNQHEPLVVKPAAKQLHLPLVVMVDGGTANLAELAAVALRDAGKAHLIGAHTFGDDVLQLFATLKNGAGVEITAAHLLTLSGTDLAGGVQPEVDLGSGVDSDAAIQRAVEIIGKNIEVGRLLNQETEVR